MEKTSLEKSLGIDFLNDFEKAADRKTWIPAFDYTHEYKKGDLIQDHTISFKKGKGFI